METVLEVFVKLFPLIYVIIFFGAVFVWLRFEWSSEGQDERGKTILNTSYRISFPLFPVGWLIIELIDNYAIAISYDMYKELIWFLMTGLMIIHALIITILKRKY